MKNKLKIIIDILFRNKEYVEKTFTIKTDYKGINHYKPETIEMLGRFVLPKNEININDEDCFKKAIRSVFLNPDVYDFIQKEKTTNYCGLDFLKNETTTVYDVKINLYKKPSD